ncbi:cytosolic carboxypeptidase 1-like isoform X2 [Mytilus galloprovincialis]|uniref:cytosolic carboxypeptidase 1-like isoform X2 n=1 Tax=Mytilus galloprovincialis TaxID=29158 RepID=UPI003F7B55D8
MERSVGSRLIGLFQQLDKIGGKAAKNPSSTDDLQQIRYVTSKIYQLLNQQEKIHRDSVLKNAAQLDLILCTLRNCSDRAVVVNIIHILLELLGKTQVGKRSSALVSANTTNILLQCMVRETEDNVTNDDLLILAHQVLAKLSSKDRKFSTKARLHRTLLITLSLIKSNICQFKNLQCLLQVFKSYTNNSVNASYLGKHNAIPPMFRVIQQCGRKHTTVLKLALEIVYNVTKSRNNAARTIGGEHVPHLLGLYQDWHQLDTKHRHVNIRKAILNILKNITNLKSGRKALADANGIQILYDTAQDVIDCREMESLILLASVIMRKCCPRNKLPCDIRSPVKFDLPESELYPESTRQEGSMSYGSSSETPDSDSSSLEDDDDIDSDDERFKTDNSEETEDDQGEAPQPFKRNPDDLRMYDKFFPEIFEIEIKEDDDLDPSLLPPTSIYIPTGNFENLMSSEAQQIKHSLYQKEGTFLYSSRTSGYSSYESDYPDNYRTGRCDSATAINMKTGSSLFSLDLPQKGAIKKTLISQPKTSKKSKAGKKSSNTNKKVGKKTSTTSYPDLLEFESEFEGMNISQDQKDVDETGSSSGEEDDTDSYFHDVLVYQDKACSTKGAYRFEKIGYPDLIGARGCPYLEPLYRRKFGVQRAKVFEDIDRMIHPEHVIDRDVYDVDATIKRCGSTYCNRNSNLSNRDELRIGSQLDAVGANSLRFNAQFECGNLRKAIWVREFEYDLILNPDVNTNHHHQWFYFEVSNMIADIPYRFNIVNCEKLNSQFNFGMKPVMFSVTESIEGRPFWSRVGTDICYYKNHFTRSAQATGGVKGKTYFTATFTVKFKHNKDICYMAYHFPYTYTTLQTHIQIWDRSTDHSQIFFRNQTFCQTISGNNVPVLTVTAQPKSYSRENVEELRSRPYIFLSGRVHPGESNSSWVMKGTIDFLLSKKPAAQQLRENFIFKIVPMLNPDGVINGNHRCSLAAEDLNRRWDNPCPKLHPTIYHTKGLLQYLQMINKSPLVYCDYHGHSRRKNIFLYGCSPTMSWIPNDSVNPATTGNRMEDNAYKTLPRILHLTSPVFSWPNCSFLVEKAKETTARVVVWRQIGVLRSYTMESTYCGIDRDGKFKDQHITTSMMEDMGQKFSEALIRTRTKYTTENMVSFPPLSDSQQNLGATAQDPDLLGDDDDLDEPVHRRQTLHRRDEDENLYSGGEDIDDMNEESSEEEMYGDDDEENYADDQS